MQDETYQFLANREATYWWHRARRNMVVGLLRRYQMPDGGRWLDLGCGPGGNLEMLARFHPAMVVGVELSPKAIEIAAGKAPHAHIVQANLNEPLPFADHSFDLVTIFNVLYHAWIDSEKDVLAEVLRVLKPGGLALVTEPAFQALHREMDRAAMTRRRYHRREFDGICRSVGLDVLYSSYFSSFGFPLIAGMKAVHRLFARDRQKPGNTAADMKPLSPVVNEPLYALATLEAKMIASGIPMPFGTTLVCVARKP